MGLVVTVKQYIIIMSHGFITGSKIHNQAANPTPDNLVSFVDNMVYSIQLIIGWESTMLAFYILSSRVL